MSLIAGCAVVGLGGAGHGGAPPIPMSGKINLEPGSSFYFYRYGNPRLVTPPAGDIEFEVFNPTRMDIRPLNGAMLGSAMYANAQGTGPWSPAFCAHANYGAQPQPVTPDIVGASFCVVTGYGGTAEFKVRRLPGARRHV